MSEVVGLYVMMSLILNWSVGLRHIQQCDNVCFVHICRCTNQRDELNIQSQTSTLYFCYITSFPSLSLPVYVLKNYIWNICIKNVVDARFFWATVCKTVHPMLSHHCPVCPVCLSACPLLSVTLVYCVVAKHWMDQNETWHTGRYWPWPHCVRWGPSSPLPKGAHPPIFAPCLLWPNGCMHQVPLGT